MRFAEPIWLLGALLAVALAGVLALGAWGNRRNLARFGELALVERLVTAASAQRRLLKGVLLVLAVAATFLALAKPQFGWGTRHIPATNLDVVIALDFSKSMYARDVAPSRTERAKSEVAQLIRRLPGARFGAVAFAGEPLSFPLTSDGGAIAQFFRQLTPHDMPVGGTAIARALEAARALLERDPTSSKHRRVILLVTDGEDLEGDPVASAQSAEAASISIHVVQIGGRTAEPIPNVDNSGRAHGLRRDPQGRVMTTALSAEGEATLARIAELTRGSVVRSEGGSTGIEEIAQDLRRLMTEELSERVETVYADVYFYPLGFAILLLLLESWLTERGRRQAEAETRKQVALSAIVLAGVLSACDTGRVDPWFMHDAPAVERARVSLSPRGDAGVAAKELLGYLGLGPCSEGRLSVGPSVAERPQATFDLGLALFRMAERYGQRFGAEPLPGGEEPGLLAQRSLEVECGLAALLPLLDRSRLGVPMRARALYLYGNLEFLRGEYEAAVDAYDRALTLVPGREPTAKQGEAAPSAAEPMAEQEALWALGRDCAHNRAIAQRRAAEKKKEEEDPPDAGPPPPADGGATNSQGDPDEPGSGGSGDPPDSDESSEPGDAEQDPSPDSSKPNDSSEPSTPDPSAAQQEPPSDKAQGDSRQPTPSDSQQAPPQAPPPSVRARLSQDERLLDELEQAPTLQQAAARARAGGTRAVVEDK